MPEFPENLRVGTSLLLVRRKFPSLFGLNRIIMPPAVFSIALIAKHKWVPGADVFLIVWGTDDLSLVLISIYSSYAEYVKVKTLSKVQSNGLVQAQSSPFT